ncbi:interferon regulatory factor 5 [Monodelphis domestica]|uniref:interferon regulatory factor 5 n=1 Tax=Monodelphis domestica TaxID=13616 RepID=UPI0024E2263A|nr:interferon regulatory factor 5 [Monodelphis domestica]
MFLTPDPTLCNTTELKCLIFNFMEIIEIFLFRYEAWISIYWASQLPLFGVSVLGSGNPICGLDFLGFSGTSEFLDITSSHAAQLPSCLLSLFPSESLPGEEEDEEEEELQRMLPSLRITGPKQPAPAMVPYPVPKEEQKWPSPSLQPPLGLGPSPPEPAILAPPPGPPANFVELIPEVLPGSGPLAASLAPPPEQPLPDLLISPHMLPLTDLEIKFQYRGQPPYSLTISNPQGCRLFYSQLEATQEQVELFGPVSLEQVRFPGPEGIPSDKQRFYTNQLLDVLDRGLILQLQGQDLYAIRLCQCKVFWSGPCATPCATSRPIQREKKTKLFSLEQFLNELILFQKGQTTTPPAFEIFFCFGEEWPDRKPKEKKLITVQVVPVAARLLLEMFSGELSWSADSIRLQISNPDLKDRMVEQFKELHHIWQQHQRLPPAPSAPAGTGPWPVHQVGMHQ